MLVSYLKQWRGLINNSRVSQQTVFRSFPSKRYQKLKIFPPLSQRFNTAYGSAFALFQSEAERNPSRFSYFLASFVYLLLLLHEFSFRRFFDSVFRCHCACVPMKSSPVSVCLLFFLFFVRNDYNVKYEILL